MFNVLMICTGNICRSPIAAGLLKHYLPPDFKERVVVTSAGTHALHGHQAQEHALAAMSRLGIDISDHRARQLTREIARSADLILTMEAVHAAMVKRVLGWTKNKSRMISEFQPDGPVHDIQDPYGEPPEAYEECIRTLRPCIKGVIIWLGTNLQ